jgi:hypothetical protein
VLFRLYVVVCAVACVGCASRGEAHVLVRDPFLVSVWQHTATGSHNLVPPSPAHTRTRNGYGRFLAQEPLVDCEPLPPFVARDVFGGIALDTYGDEWLETSSGRPGKRELVSADGRIDLTSPRTTEIVRRFGNPGGEWIAIDVRVVRGWHQRPTIATLSIVTPLSNVIVLETAVVPMQ